MQTDFGQLTEEWAEKGEVTEQEARSFVDNLISGQDTQSTSSTSDPSSTTTTATPTADPDMQQELQDLTTHIIALREELEKLQSESDSSP